MQLPETLEDQFWAELSAHEEAQKMSYITSVERIGIKKGIRQGIPQGEALILKRQLQRRFGPLPEWATEKPQADQTSLETWADRVLDATTLEEVFQKH